MIKKIGLLTVLFLSLTTGLNARAVSERILPQAFRAHVLPFLAAHARYGVFEGTAHVMIQYIYMAAQAPKGVIVLSPGQGEAALKYSEVLYDLRDSGYSIFVIDHRGQGFSQRLLPDPIKSHVIHFADYVDDFAFFVNQIVKPQTYKKSLLLAHSMGGGIAAGYLTRFPKVFTGAVFTSPMFEINTQPYGAETAVILSNALNLIGRGNDYAPGQKPYDPEETFAESKSSSSEARFDMEKNLLAMKPELRLGGTTVHWVKEALGFTIKLRQTQNLFQIPTLLFQAGRDKKVMPQGQEQLCGESPQFCRMVRFPDSEHGILMEKDVIRDRAMGLIKNFLNSL